MKLNAFVSWTFNVLLVGTLLYVLVAAPGFLTDLSSTVPNHRPAIAAAP